MKFIKRNISEGYFPSVNKKSSISAEDKLANAAKNSINRLIESTLRTIYHKYQSDKTYVGLDGEPDLTIKYFSKHGCLFDDVHNGYDYKSITYNVYFEKYEPVVSSITTNDEGKFVITFDIDLGNLVDMRTGKIITNPSTANNVLTKLFPHDWHVTDTKNEHIENLYYFIKKEIVELPESKRKGYELLYNSELILNKVIMYTNCSEDINIDINGNYCFSDYIAKPLLSAHPGVKEDICNHWKSSIGKLIEFRNKGKTTVTLSFTNRKGYSILVPTIEKGCKLPGMVNKIYEYTKDHADHREGVEIHLNSVETHAKNKYANSKTPSLADVEHVSISCFTRKFRFSLEGDDMTYVGKDIILDKLAFDQAYSVKLGYITSNENAFYIHPYMPYNYGCSDFNPARISGWVYDTAIEIKRPPASSKDEDYEYMQTAFTRMEAWLQHYIDVKRFPLS